MHRTPHGQHICRQIVAEPGVEVKVDWKPDWQGKQGGGGGTNSSHTGQRVDNPFANAKL